MHFFLSLETQVRGRNGYEVIEHETINFFLLKIKIAGKGIQLLRLANKEMLNSGKAALW